MVVPLKQSLRDTIRWDLVIISVVVRLGHLTLVTRQSPLFVRANETVGETESRIC